MSDITCSIPGCEKKSGANGKKSPCSMHRARIARHGSPDVVLPPRSTPPISGHGYLERYVPTREAGKCWEWTGPLDSRGYGVARSVRSGGNRGPARAHRVVYEALDGEIPEGKLLMHSCDNPRCVNPEHLTPGTDAENLADMRRKGRSARGEKHRAAKMTEAQVMEARRKYATGQYTIAALAAEYGLTSGPAYQMLRGITWKHLPLINRGAE